MDVHHYGPPPFGSCVGSPLSPGGPDSPAKSFLQALKFPWDRAPALHTAWGHLQVLWLEQNVAQLGGVMQRSLSS